MNNISNDEIIGVQKHSGLKGAFKAFSLKPRYSTIVPHLDFLTKARSILLILARVFLEEVVDNYKICTTFILQVSKGNEAGSEKEYYWHMNTVGSHDFYSKTVNQFQGRLETFQDNASNLVLDGIKEIIVKACR